MKIDKYTDGYIIEAERSIANTENVEEMLKWCKRFMDFAWVENGMLHGVVEIGIDSMHHAINYGFELEMTLDAALNKF